MYGEIHPSSADEQASVWKPDFFGDPVRVDVHQIASTVEEHLGMKVERDTHE